MPLEGNTPQPRHGDPTAKLLVSTVGSYFSFFFYSSPHYSSSSSSNRNKISTLIILVDRVYVK